MDQQHIESTKRVAKNTLFLYGRMLLGMLVALYTSRVILNALGVEDFGIYGVVGGLVAMFSIVSGSLQASITRYLTFELGTANFEKLKHTFSAAFFIQILLALTIFILGETIGLWILNSILNIPENRLFAANIVFQASLFSFMLGLVLMPYNACINAHERMNVYAYLGLLDIGMKLAIVLFVAYAPFDFDKLIMYSLLLVGVGVLMQIISVAYCRRNFGETKVMPSFNRDIMKSMLGFAGWNFIGASSALLRDTGSNILLNIFFGPVVNAARGVAGSVSNAVGGFTGNFNAAVNPQITKSYASHDYDYMFSLIYRSAKFGFLLTLIFAMPIFFNTESILFLWLGEVPDYSIGFVQLILIFSLIETVSSPLITVQLATGNIRNYQLVVGGLQTLNFPLSWIFLWVGLNPYSVFVIAIIISLLCLIARLLFLKNLIGLDIRSYCNRVLLPCILVATISSIVAYFSDGLKIDENILNLFLRILICIIGTCVPAFFIGCTSNERDFMLDKLRLVKKKIIFS